MTLTSDIITAAYRESNFKGQGQTLTALEQSEGLAMLQSLVDSFFGLVVGTKAKPWWVPFQFNTAPEAQNFPAAPGNQILRNNGDINYPPPNTRIFLRNTGSETIYFQMKPEDGALMQIVDAGFSAEVVLDGNGVFIGDTGISYTATITPQFGSGSRNPTRTYVFRGDIASWVLTSDLIYAGDFPFPADLDDYFITALAMRLAPRFGNMPNQATIMRYTDMLTYARGLYRQTEESIGNGPQRASHNYYVGVDGDDPDTGRI